MKARTAVQGLLVVASVVAFGIGASILWSPDLFYADFGFFSDATRPTRSVALKSELRGSGGFLVGSSVLMSLGIASPKFTFTSTLVASALYLSYGFGRALGLWLDGWPHPSLVQAGCVELALGAASAGALVWLRAER